MSGPVAIARNVRFRYGEGPTAFEALRGVSLTVEAGEVLMIRGPSGSGKTTLLQLLGALKTPTAGSLSLFGTAVENLSPEALRGIRVRRVGFVFQSYNLFPTLTAWENVAVSLDLQGCPRPAARERAHRLLAELGLSERTAAYPAKLSGGQRQRVAIARALAHDPALILCDEPTAALDWSAGRLVTECLRSLAHDQGRAVVIVSHDSRVEPLVDRILTIEDGLLMPHADTAPEVV